MSCRLYATTSSNHGLDLWRMYVLLFSRWIDELQLYLSKRYRISTPEYLHLNQCRDIANSSLRNKPQWNLKQNSYIIVQENALENIVGEVAFILSRPQCVNNIIRLHSSVAFFLTVANDNMKSGHISYLRWRHNRCDGVSNHRRSDSLNRLFRRRSSKTSKLSVTGLRWGDSPVTAKFPAQRASNAENVSIWWRHRIDMHNRIRQLYATLWFWCGLILWITSQYGAIVDFIYHSYLLWKQLPLKFEKRISWRWLFYHECLFNSVNYLRKTVAIC